MKSLSAYAKIEPCKKGNRMSKVAAYLRGHLAGEVTTRTDIREAMSEDRGVLRLKPDMVIYPRTTNDIRKVARFAWQLAEKGHVLPLTVRGAGTDGTGAAIGKGVVLVTTAHMNKVFEYDAKQKLIRLQPGATIGTVSQALSLHGTGIMPIVGSHPYGTIGGAIASAVTGPLAGKYGTIERAVDQLEVVLANGDVLQTGRISKKELSRKKGLAGFEGDIYRGIDGVIEEYGDVLDQLASNDATGYNTIADVKQKDGSFDLTPLFIGSQGTLGVISEMILRAEFRSLHVGVAALAFEHSEAARDALDDLARMNPAFLEYFDAALFDAATDAGRNYAFYTSALEHFKPSSVVLVGFDEFGERQRLKSLKRIEKKFAAPADVMCTIVDGTHANELLDALDVAYYTEMPDRAETAVPALYEGFHVPTERLEDFVKALDALAEREKLALPLAGHVITNTYSVYPALSLKKVGDKQKIFKLLDQLAKLVHDHGGTMIAEGGEGRAKTRAVYATLDPKVVEMYEAVRKVCDPHGTLNPGVKQSSELKTLVSMLRDDHDAGQFARFGL